MDIQINKATDDQAENRIQNRAEIKHQVSGINITATNLVGFSCAFSKFSFVNCGDDYIARIDVLMLHRYFEPKQNQR